jgi:hypothetical protein
MSHIILTTAIALTTLLTSFSVDARHLTKRDRKLRKWNRGIVTSYLNTQHFSQCWATSQMALVPDQIRQTIRYNSCLNTNQYILRHSRKVKRYIRNQCSIIASQPIAPTMFQQRQNYQSCLQQTQQLQTRIYIRRNRNRIKNRIHYNNRFKHNSVKWNKSRNRNKFSSRTNKKNVRRGFINKSSNHRRTKKRISLNRNRTRTNHKTRIKRSRAIKRSPKRRVSIKRSTRKRTSRKRTSR